MGVTNTLLWVTDSTPADLSNQEDAANKKVGVVPPPGGTIFRVVEFAPEREVKADYETRLRIIQGIGLAPEGNLPRESRAILPCTGQRPSTML